MQFLLVRPERERQCLQKDFLQFFRHSACMKLWKRPKSTLLPENFRRIQHWFQNVLSVHRTIQSAMWRLSAEVACPNQEKFHWRIMVCCFWMNCRNSKERCLK